MAKRNWIAKATKNKGGLRSAAKKSEIRKNGNLNLPKIAARAERTGNTRLKRQVALAKTLSKMRKRKEG